MLAAKGVTAATNKQIRDLADAMQTSFRTTSAIPWAGESLPHRWGLTEKA